MIAIGFFLIFYIGFGVFLALKQESIIYQPFAQDFDDCPTLAGAEKITHDGTRMYYHDNGNMLMVVYHGNAGSACDRAFLATLAEQAGYSYLLPEYAGYSNDSQKPSHEAIKKDVEHVVDFINSDDFDHVVVYGESIGTGAASYHSSLQPPSKLILLAPFTNLVDIARERFWFYPSALFVDNAFDNMELLSKYRGQVLIAHGENDDIIPLPIGMQLFDAVPSREKQFVTIAGAGHNTVYESPEFYDALRAFLSL